MSTGQFYGAQQETIAGVTILGHCVWVERMSKHVLFGTCQRKFRNLTSDYYIECCRQVSKHRCLTAEMFYGRRCGTWGSLAGRNCAKCCVFHTFAAPRAMLCRLTKSAFKKGSCGGSVAQDVGKICATLRHESDVSLAKLNPNKWKQWKCRNFNLIGKRKEKIKDVLHRTLWTQRTRLTAEPLERACRFSGAGKCEQQCGWHACLGQVELSLVMWGGLAWRPQMRSTTYIASSSLTAPSRWGG